MTRLYALLANGGKLVEPRIVKQIEQNQTEGAPPLRRAAASRRRSRGRSASTRRRSRRPAGPLRGDARVYGTSTSVFGALPDTRSRARRARPRSSSSCPASPGCATSRGGAAGDRPTTPKLVVCALIENGGHGGTAAAPAALKVFEQFFGVEAGSYEARRWRATDGRSESHAAARPRARRGPPTSRGSCATSTTSSSPRSRGSSPTGSAVLGSVTRNDVAGNPDYYVVRQSMNIAIGVVALLVLTLSTPEIFRRLRASALPRACSRC